MSVCAVKSMLMTGAMLSGGARAESTDKYLLLSARVLGESCLQATPSSWWAPQPGVGRHVNLLTNQTVYMGDRSLNHGLKAP